MATKKEKSFSKNVICIDLELKKNPKISMLKNSHEFYKSKVFLMTEPDNDTEHYRMIVAKRIGGAKTEDLNNIEEKFYIIVSKIYDTIRGAHIAFGKMFKDKGSVARQEWTSFYTPESDWINRFAKCQLHPDSSYDPKKKIILPKKKDEEEECTATLKSENSSKPSLRSNLSDFLQRQILIGCC